ncbi:uncharacterized protein BKA78DRAFT_19737 [Phyllosticta capitalensis]|uniref:uncharacterized protein n=1 Tax=Phyllosticta capitalensis TaxID=121624 RepID=UPI00312DFA10
MPCSIQVCPSTFLLHPQPYSFCYSRPSHGPPPFHRITRRYLIWRQEQVNAEHHISLSRAFDPRKIVLVPPRRSAVPRMLLVAWYARSYGQSAYPLGRKPWMHCNEAKMNRMPARRTTRLEYAEAGWRWQCVHATKLHAQQDGGGHSHGHDDAAWSTCRTDAAAAMNFSSLFNVPKAVGDRHD